MALLAASAAAFLSMQALAFGMPGDAATLACPVDSIRVWLRWRLYAVGSLLSFGLETLPPLCPTPALSVEVVVAFEEVE